MEATLARHLRIYHKYGKYRVCEVQGQRIFKFHIMQIYLEYILEDTINIIRNLITFY